MNTTRILIPALWLVSLIAAFIIGGKINSTADSTSTSSEDTASHRPAHRQSGSSAAASSKRRSSGNRQSSPDSSVKGEFNIQDIAKNDDPIARANDLLRLINRLGANDFAQVVADFRELGITRERMSEYGMLLHAWAKVDPLGALDYAEKNTGSSYARQTILASWAGNDVDGALAWAEGHHEGDGANPWLVGVIKGIVSKDPGRATEIMQNLPYSRERGDAISAITPHIARQGIEKASLWLDSITDERLKNGSTYYLASALAKTDPQGTAEWVASLADSDGKARATSEVAEEWAEQDLASAVAWTNTLGEATRTRAARQVISEYARENPEQAASWLHSMSSDPGYEKVVESYIWNTVRSNPALSLAQVPEISEPKSQEKYYERILRSWRERDAAAVETWMSNNNISEKVRQKVMEQNKQDRRRGR